MVAVPPGIVLIDKPTNMTSFGVVARVRRVLGGIKVGHCGTLDPQATGLMVLGVGRGTKLLTDLTKLDKEYVSEILLGQARTTSDMEGEVTAEKEIITQFSPETLSATAARLVGTLTLPVSAFSAIKKDGVPMYKRAYAAASKGEVVSDVPMRGMRVDAAEFLSTTPFTLDGKQFQLVTVRFAVGSGTYIRSLAEELGRLLDHPAVVYSLRRTKVGEWSVTDAPTLDTFLANPPGIL